MSFLDSTESLRSLFEERLSSTIPDAPESLYDPVRHVISAGGKRVRPMLTALAYRLSYNDERWVQAGMGIELLHTFTLVHDDIMDNAASRRGHQTVHAKYGTNEAILSGDVIIALAQQAIAKAHYPNSSKMFEEFSVGFVRVCEGQALDKEFEQRDNVTVGDYLDMIDLKTAKVLETAGVLGALAASREDHVEPIRSFAHHVGIAFQVQDDLLDLTADHAEFGKTIGGDILEGKRTYLLVKLLERQNELRGNDLEVFSRVMQRTAGQEDIAAMREIMQKTGVIIETERIIREHTDLALKSLDAINEDTKQLREFAEYLLTRRH